MSLVEALMLLMQLRTVTMVVLLTKRKTITAAWQSTIRILHIQLHNTYIVRNKFPKY
jgi:hypothetical protein